MDGFGHTLFGTAIGRCGIARGLAGITAVQLPESNAEATRARLLKNAGLCPEVTESPDAVLLDNARRIHYMGCTRKAIWKLSITH